MRGIQALAWAAERDFTFVHFDFDDLRFSTLDDLQEFRVAAGQFGVELGGFAINKLESVGVSDQLAASRVIDAAVNIATTLAVPFVYLPSFGAAHIRNERDLRLTAKLITHALNRADSMTVASENTLASTPQRLLFELVDNRRARLLFDTQNPVMESLDPISLLSNTFHLLGSFVHVKDGYRQRGNRALGRGECRISEILCRLGELGYCGRYVVENDYRGSSDPAADLGFLTAIAASNLRPS